MKCKNCGKILNENMQFCPYCGCHMSGNGKYMGMDEDNKKAEKLFKQAKYNDLLDMAISGNMVAKGLYIQYIDNEADKGMMRNLKCYTERAVDKHPKIW